MPKHLLCVFRGRKARWLYWFRELRSNGLRLCQYGRKFRPRFWGRRLYRRLRSWLYRRGRWQSRPRPHFLLFLPRPALPSLKGFLNISSISSHLKPVCPIRSFLQVSLCIRRRRSYHPSVSSYVSFLLHWILARPPFLRTLSSWPAWSGTHLV